MSAKHNAYEVIVGESDYGKVFVVSMAVVRKPSRKCHSALE